MSPLEEPPLRVALVDSDALQRTCMRASLTSIGADCVAFNRHADLHSAMSGQGRVFDALVLALHTDARETLAALPALRAAAGPQSAVLLMTHSSQLRGASEWIRNVLSDDRVDLILSPVDECELPLRLLALTTRNTRTTRHVRRRSAL
jgi:DNA-binding NtrC family response regulator